MTGTRPRWEKLGRILKADPSVSWMSTWTGAASTEPLGKGLHRVYLTGRDRQNRSQIGTFILSLKDRPKILSVSAKPVLSLGELGAFDENGIAYPCFVRSGNKRYLYYVGWSPSVLVPFQNHIGLAVSVNGGAFRRVSRAPILERTDDDFLSTGSCHVLKEGSRWRMWYTSWKRWVPAKPAPTHEYLIKYAESRDGVRWDRKGIAVGFKDRSEYAVARPAVLHHEGLYRMWFTARGREYRIGHAVSKDGKTWTRRDRDAGIGVSQTGWDNRSQCYPHVFRNEKDLYMLYNGNDYGREGLGLARWMP